MKSMNIQTEDSESVYSPGYAQIHFFLSTVSESTIPAPNRRLSHPIPFCRSYDGMFSLQTNFNRQSPNTYNNRGILLEAAFAATLFTRAVTLWFAVIN